MTVVNGVNNKVDVTLVRMASRNTLLLPFFIAEVASPIGLPLPGISIKRGDTRSALRVRLMDYDDTVIDLNGATVNFIMSNSQLKVLQNRAAVVQGLGNVLVTFGPNDFEAGSMYVEIEVIFADGKRETYPDKGYISIPVEKDLG